MKKYILLCFCQKAVQFSNVTTLQSLSSDIRPLHLPYTKVLINIRSAALRQTVSTPLIYFTADIFNYKIKLNRIKSFEHQFFSYPQKLH